MSEPVGITTAPPAPGPPRAATLPAPVERTLDNGLRVIAFSLRSRPTALAVPLVSAQLLVRGGGSRESEAEAGLCSLTSTLLTTGTTTRSAREIAQEIDALGARLDASSGFDASVVSVSAMTPVFAQAFAVFEDVVRRPSLAQAELDRVRAKTISDLNLTYSSPGALARLVANRVAYGASPYGHPLAGTAQTLEGLTRDAVAAFAATWYRPDNAVLVVGGDCDTDDMFRLADRVLGSWRAPSGALPERALPHVPPPSPRVVAIDKPDAGRTAIVVGRIAIARNSPLYDAGTIATAVLSGYSGRLNTEIRVKRGLSYGAGAQLVARRDGGLFLASTLVDHARVGEAVGVILTSLETFAREPVDERELGPRKETVVGSFNRGIETIDGIAATVGELALFDMPLDDVGRHAARLLAVTPGDVQHFARTAVADAPFVVLVGDVARFAADVAAVRPNIETIAFDRLDLNRADLVEATAAATAARSAPSLGVEA